MLAFGSVLQPFREQPWFLSAVRAIDDARRGSVPVEAAVSRVESRSSSQSVATNLAMEDPLPEVATMVVEDGAPSSRPITRSASARRSPPAEPLASGSGVAGDPMVVDEAVVSVFFFLSSPLTNYLTGSRAASPAFASEASSFAP